MKALLPLLAFAACVASPACHRGAETTKDELYSRHLQRKVALTILHSKPPKDRADFNLLILNEAGFIDQLGMKNVLDSLSKKDRVKPLVIIGVDADQAKEFGVSDKVDYKGGGSKASFYSDFINNELYPYAKKQSGVRRFAMVAIAGFGDGGLSAFDVAWNHPDKINEVGVFSGSFGKTDQAPQDSALSAHGLLQTKLKASRKKPGLSYWFYAGRLPDTVISTETAGIIGQLMDKKVVTYAGTTFYEIPGGTNTAASWEKAFPDFLVWAFGK